MRLPLALVALPVQSKCVVDQNNTVMGLLLPPLDEDGPWRVFPVDGIGFAPTPEDAVEAAFGAGAL